MPRRVVESDVCIIGSGIAAAMVAEKLAEERRLSITVVEAGEESDRLGARTAEFGRFVHTLFSFRRKTLRRALSQAGHDADAVLAVTGFDGGKRPEVFSPPQILAMYEALPAGGSDR